jgi:Domain of unknown function(DUF2779)
MNRYLTKSRFLLGLECPTKLYYTRKEKEYADESIDDPFLEALSEGGFQVAELAKFLFCEDPVKEDITIRELNYETALAKTNERLKATETMIAEAAFKYKNLFVRTDILVKSPFGLQLYEVKSKSWDSKSSFWKQNNKGERWLSKDWLPYLYDVAYQKYVLKKVYPQTNIEAFLILADKECPATVEGLNQHFRIQKENGDSRIIISEGTTKSGLGTIPLIKINVDKECDWIYFNPVEVDLEGDYSFEEIISRFSEAYQKDERIWSILSSKCKRCQFNGEDPAMGLKSGFKECWKHQANLSDKEFENPFVLEIWGGKAGSRSIVKEAIASGKYFLADLEHEDYCRHWPHVCENGLHASERREMQILKARNKDSSFYLDKKGIEKVFREFERPWHFIDFETSMVALPFHAGRKPYEAIAFQYSYHMMDEKGRIEHKSEYICLDPDFPNYAFVRNLKKDLEGNGGTIFRYHNHENSYLRFIYRQLMEEKEGVIPDRAQLVAFIREITHSGKDDVERWVGDQDMQDLYDLVLKYYYSPKAKGSNSIKDILPAVINDSRYVSEKYSQPIYGIPGLPSLNFKNHIWINESSGFNPYKTLPPVLAGYDNDKLDELIPAVEEINDGGAAMMAYAYLQFTEVPPSQKEQIRKALLRYCELDTMAMVMIWEFWGNEIGVF